MRRYLWMALLLAGCGQQPAEPVVEPSPTLNSGLSQVQWISSPDDCSGCVLSIQVDDRRGLHVVRVENGQFIIHGTEVKQVEWQTARDLVTPIVDQRQRVGCDSTLPEETFGTFAGDAGWSTRVEGCDAPEVEQARTFLSDLVRRYLPDAAVLRKGCL